MIFDDTDELYKKYMAFNGVMLEEHEALEIAAILVIQGLTFYKTIMTEEEYQKMVKNIYDMRDSVRTFD